VDPTNLMQPLGVNIDLIDAVMDRPDLHVPRPASVMKGYYADPAALERLIASGDPLHYETFEKDIPQEHGHLVFCISKLQPGLVGEEFFMTKGHFHEAPEMAEIYLCIRGCGYMLMKTSRDGSGRSDCVAEPMVRNRLVYVPPYWAHRSINTGVEPLISLCIYPGGAGHDFDDIREHGFPKRIFKVEGKEVIR